MKIQIRKYKLEKTKTAINRNSELDFSIKKDQSNR